MALDRCIINSILITLILIVLYYWIYCEDIEEMINIKPIKGQIKWVRNKKCKYKMSKTVQDVINSNHMEKGKGENWNVHFPCTYNNIDDEIDNIDTSTSADDQRMFIIHNADQISSKSAIWRNLINYYGRDRANNLMPDTYQLFKKEDRDLFNNEFCPNKLYILKKNLQRQTGIEITNDKNKIMNGYKNGYVVVQELLQDPYLVDNRKINMRVYLLIICKDGELEAYVHRDGFMYYTAEYFKKKSLKTGPNITTGYIDRQVYIDNPLTLEDFRKYLDKPSRSFNNKEKELIKNKQIISEYTFSKINELIKNIVMGVNPSICMNDKIKKNISFQLFGADIALSDTLVPKLMEINKGPDLGAKDIRDSEVKHSVVTDMFKVIKIINDDDHNFIQVL